MAPFLAYEDKGTGTSSVPLVLVHGHPFDRTMWHPQIEAFAASRRVVAPDLRGYGASPSTPVSRASSSSPRTSRHCWTS